MMIIELYSCFRWISYLWSDPSQLFPPVPALCAKLISLYLWRTDTRVVSAVRKWIREPFKVLLEHFTSLFDCIEGGYTSCSCRCAECQKTFQYPSQLQNHMMKHKDIRPHICSECGMEFIQSHHLKQHTLTHKVGFIRRTKRNDAVCSPWFSFLDRDWKQNNGFWNQFCCHVKLAHYYLFTFWIMKLAERVWTLF